MTTITAPDGTVVAETRDPWDRPHAGTIPLFHLRARDVQVAARPDAPHPYAVASLGDLATLHPGTGNPTDDLRALVDLGRAIAAQAEAALAEQTTEEGA